LHCYTPEEFQRQKAGLGYLGQAKRRGELLRVPAARQSAVLAANQASRKAVS
jgi:hypothetical protein